MKFIAILLPDAESGFTALNPETGTVSQGESESEALANLREAVALYLEEFPGTVKPVTPIIASFELALHA
jgi:predicted RNase H-like HicB family nuclease